MSGRVRDSFIARGHDAISCDLLPTEQTGPHIQGDILPLLKKHWDMMLAFPPCTHLANSGAAWFAAKRKDGRQQQGIDFFMRLAEANIPRICIENPVGIMSSRWRKPDQIIQPWQFGDSAQKSTCLWLKNLPLLEPTKTVDKGEFVQYKSGRMPKWYADTWRLPRDEWSKVRSRTFPGIAKAMAEQWG